MFSAVRTSLNPFFSLAIGHWHSIKPRAPSAKERGYDYKTMNCKAIKDGYVTAHEQNLYRKLKDIRLSDNDERRFKRTPPKVPADMTYGKPARTQNTMAPFLAVGSPSI
uniref:Uncharacterized protein n=1 Tax=Sphaerodactylus townsendi TaxID=933632 RepID=A0ACB8F1A6_9SAUR